MDRGFETLLHWKSYETKKLDWKLWALSDFVDTPLTSHWLPFKGDTREKEFTSVFLCLCVGLSISPSFHAKPSLKSAIRVHSLLILAVVTMMKTKGILCPELTVLHTVPTFTTQVQLSTRSFLRYKWTQKWHSVGASIASSLLLEMQFWTQAMLVFSCRTQKHLTAIVQNWCRSWLLDAPPKKWPYAVLITTCCKGSEPQLLKLEGIASQQCSGVVLASLLINRPWKRSGITELVQCQEICQGVHTVHWKSTNSCLVGDWYRTRESQQIVKGILSLLMLSRYLARDFHTCVVNGLFFFLWK